VTDRINAFIVVLEADIREDEIAQTLNALKQIRGVLDVQPHVPDVVDYVVAHQRLKHDFIRKLVDFAREELSE
jgi:hypothetical protein